MPELIPPTTRLRKSWLESRDEWGRGVHQHGAGLLPDTDVDSETGFEAWVGRLAYEEDTTTPPLPGWVHCTHRWMVDGERYLGAISLRHSLNDNLREVGGHIGYGVRPSERRRGLAGWALAETLDRARGLGLDRVLITCLVTNVASARTIEGAGGVFEDVRSHAGEPYRRYWIALP
jgi:predicted acetyltransferase